MKHERLWAHIASVRLVLPCLALGMSVALPTGAQSETSAGTAEPFVLDQYYLGKEGAPPSLAEFFGSPMQYLRSVEAYVELRAHFASKLGVETLSEEDFEALHANGRVRLRPCAEVGPFRTDGITPTGVVARSPRTICYTGEQFIELRIGDTWVVVASQGCFNPIELVVVVPPLPRKEPVCVRVPMDVNVNDAGTHTHLDGTVHPNCCCAEHPHVTPTFNFHMESTQHADGSYLQCR